MLTVETESQAPLVNRPLPACSGQIVDSAGISEEPFPVSAIWQPLPRPPLVDAESRIIWPYIIGVTLFHLLIPLAFLPYFFSWWGVAWLPLGNYLFCSMGIGAGYHRLLTHRGYKCPLWFEHCLAILGVCNLQESPARWVVVHRLHHQHSDHEPDPHTPLVSWFWGHVGWTFIENRHTTSAETYHKYAGDILSDPFYMRLERNLLYVWVYVFQAALFFVVGLGVGYFLDGTLAGSYAGWPSMAAVGRRISHARYVARHLGRQLGLRICGAIAIMPPAKTAATTGCLRCAPTATVGTTIITPTREPPPTAIVGGSSTSRI